MQHNLKYALAGLAAVTGAAADAKRAAKLPPEAKAKLRELQKSLSATRKKTLEEVAAARAKALDDFFAAYPEAAKMKGLPISAIRRVVSSFIINDYDSAEGIESTGDNKLVVKGAVVAERPAAFSKYMKVCPGEFGADKVSRRTANELLSLMSAGIKVHDRENRAFLDPDGKRGRIVSSSACYTVEVTGKIRQAANKNVRQAIEEIGRPGDRVIAMSEGDTPEFRKFKQQEEDFRAMEADFRRLGDERKAKQAAAEAKKAASAAKAAATRAANKAAKAKADAAKAKAAAAKGKGGKGKGRGKSGGRRR